MEKILKCIAWFVILAFVATIFSVPIANFASNPDRYQASIVSIDDKVSTVLTLTAASTALSAGLTFLPDDAATPIAEKLADFSGYFLLILCVLYAEKYLLSMTGLAFCRVIVPIVCGLVFVGSFWKPQELKQLAFKLLAFGLALLLVIPCGLWVSDKIYDTYRSSIDETISAAHEFTAETAELSLTTDEGLFNKILHGISETVTTLFNKVTGIVNKFVEALAVLIVTSCVIPILVLLFFLWLIKMLTGIDITAHSPNPLHFGRKAKLHME